MAGSSDAQALLLQVSADTTKALKQLDNLSKKLSGVADDAGKASRRGSASLEKFFGKTDPAKALDKVFDATRFRVLDTGAAKIGLFGSALESLGPAGLVAAAGVGAFGLALAGARDAAKFADDISDTADRLHVTTDALQEYRYAIRAAGGEEKGADEALEGFSETLGKAQAGLPKAQKGFLLLGFSKAQIKAFTDVETTLPKIATALQGLSDAQKDAAISQLGLSGLKQLLDEGPDAMAHLRDEAHKLGIVMDTDLVKRGGELNDQFETVTKVIDVQLKSALVDLGPVLLYLLKLVGEIIAEFSDLIESFKSIENRRTTTLQRQRDRLTKELGIMELGGNNPVTSAARAEKRQQIASIDRELASDKRTPVKPPVVKPTRGLTDLSKSKGGSGPKDDTDQRVEQVNATLASSGRDLYQAMLGLTSNIEARAAIEKQIADQEAEAARARLDKQIADIKDDKGISQATRDALIAKLEIAKQNADEAADAKQSAIDRDAAFAIEDTQIEVHTAIVNALLDQLQAEADIATTAAARNKIEDRILELRQQLESDLEGTRLDRAVKTGELTPEQAQKQKDALGVSQGAARTQADLGQENPLQRYLRSIQDIDTEVQNIGVRAFDSLADGLADAIVNAHSLGDVAKNVFRQMIADLLAAQLKKGITSLVSGFIPGFASGTDYASGGMAWVGEHGRELVNLPRGSQVIPNHKAVNLSPGRVVAPGKAGDVNLHVNVLATGAIPREEIEGMVRRGSLQAVAAARQLASTDARQRQYQDTLNA